MPPLLGVVMTFKKTILDERLSSPASCASDGPTATAGFSDFTGKRLEKEYSPSPTCRNLSVRSGHFKQGGPFFSFGFPKM